MGVQGKDGIDLGIIHISKSELSETTVNSEEAFVGANSKDLSKVINMLDAANRLLEGCTKAIDVSVSRALR
jgi:hypothetical protein